MAVVRLGIAGLAVIRLTVIRLLRRLLLSAVLLAETGLRVGLSGTASAVVGLCVLLALPLVLAASPAILALLALALGDVEILLALYPGLPDLWIWCIVHAFKSSPKSRDRHMKTLGNGWKSGRRWFQRNFGHLR